MTNTSRPALTRARLTGAGAVTAALALTVTFAAGPATAESQTPAGATHGAAPSRTADVMTRNLYLGADLMPVIGALATQPSAVPQAASATWAAVQATKPDERMAAVADEIASARPSAVGLQEVTRWTTYDSYPATNAGTVKYDFLDLILKDLADRGVVYHEVEGATSENFGSPPIPLVPGSGAAAVSMQDRDVILVRDDVKTSNAHTGQYQNIIRFPLADGSVLPVKRGWGSVDVRTRLATFRFVNSHLEAFGIPGVNAEGLRYLQVGELLDAQQQIAQDSGALPMVYVGDYNSDAPNAIAYQRLVSSVGSDAWLTTHPGDPGYTCCFDAAVSDPNAPLDERIDLVVTDSHVTATRATIVGEEPSDRTASGLWPSDHAGVVARLVVD